MSVLDELEALFALPAAHQRYGEVVTIAEHMLQAAACARSDGADDALVVAALLHDVGHLVDAESPDERNRVHADAGAELLAAWFGPEVCEPVRLHIPAKRYLVATDPAYAALLSPASVHTLRLQGGAFDDDACASFRAEPYAEAALQVRRWDEDAKVDHLEVPGLGSYADTIASVARG